MLVWDFVMSTVCLKKVQFWQKGVYTWNPFLKFTKIFGDNWMWLGVSGLIHSLDIGPSTHGPMFHDGTNGYWHLVHALKPNSVPLQASHLLWDGSGTNRWEEVVSFPGQMVSPGKQAQQKCDAKLGTVRRRLCLPMGVLFHGFSVWGTRSSTEHNPLLCPIMPREPAHLCLLLLY